MKVSADQLQQFTELGYTTVNGFFEPDEVAAMRKQVDHWRLNGLLRDVSTDPEKRQNLQLIPLHVRSALFRALPFAPKVIESVGALIGHPLMKILDQMFLKPASLGMGTRWHTDNGYFQLTDPMAGVAMWIAVDDATFENGTLRIVPRAFREMFPHTRDVDSDHHIRTEIDETQALDCELDAGDVAFFCFGTPHATGDNLSDSARSAVGIHFVNVDKAEGHTSERWQQIRISGTEATGGQEEYGTRVDFEKEVERILGPTE